MPATVCRAGCAQTAVDGAAPDRYSTRIFGNNTNVVDLNSDTLRFNGQASSDSFGGLVYLNDHNFVDDFIVNNGGFSITVDLTEYTTVGSTRQMMIGVGQSLSDLDTQSGVGSSNYQADLLVAFRQTTGMLEIFKNRIEDTAIPPLTRT